MADSTIALMMKEQECQRLREAFASAQQAATEVLGASQSEIARLQAQISQMETEKIQQMKVA